MNEEKVQEKIVQFQTLQGNLQKLEQREKLLLQGLDDLERTKLALTDLKDTTGEAYVPIGANNFVLGEIKDSENVLISIGSGIAIKKPREDAIEITKNRIKEFKNEATKTVQELEKMSNKLVSLREEIETVRK